MILTMDARDYNVGACFKGMRVMVTDVRDCGASARLQRIREHRTPGSGGETWRRGTSRRRTRSPAGCSSSPPCMPAGNDRHGSARAIRTALRCARQNSGPVRAAMHRAIAKLTQRPEAFGRRRERPSPGTAAPNLIDHIDWGILRELCANKRPTIP